VELGREYMERARRADPWRGMMYGLAHTLLLSVDNDREAVDRILSLAPSPEEAKRRCPIDPGELRDLGFRDTRLVARAICDRAERFEEVSRLFRSCSRERLKVMKQEQLRGRRELDLEGLKWKGIDMTLLDCGCEVPVVDRHLARYLSRVDPEFREKLGHPKSDSEVEQKLRKIQDSKNPEKYEELWRIARRHAEYADLPPGVWHVATWLRERFRARYPEMDEEKRLELARSYVRNLF
jgi:hypothetical protein